MNVLAQVRSVAETSIVQKAWKDPNRSLEIKSWVFDLKSGKIKDLGYTLNDDSKIDRIYHFDI